SQLPPPLVPALPSPPDLAAVSSPQGSRVRLVRGTGVVEVDTGALACHAPGQAAVLGGRLYVPCLDGEHRVLLRNADGRPAADPIVTDGDPELVANAGLLLVNVSSSEFGYVVKPDGSVQRIRTHDPALPAVDASRPNGVPPVAARPTPNAER